MATANASPALRSGDTHGVHTDNDPVAIDKGTAAIARVDGGVRLNEPDRPGVPHGAYDASSDGVRENAKR